MIKISKKDLNKLVSEKIFGCSDQPADYCGNILEARKILTKIRQTQANLNYNKAVGQPIPIQICLAALFIVTGNEYDVEEL